MALQGQFDTATGMDSQRTFFTVEQANRALPYVSRIVDDIRVTYQRAVGLQEQIEHPMPGEDIDDTQNRYAAAIEQLNGYVDELQQVGVELKDYEIGLIDFPAMHDGREVCLCWKRGEKSVLTWHETDAGFAGRQSVEMLEKSPSSN